MAEPSEKKETENKENVISNGGKIGAGFLFILLTALTIFFIIGLWPNKLPSPGSSCSRYCSTLFHIELMEVCDTIKKDSIRPDTKTETEPTFSEDTLKRDTSVTEKSIPDTTHGSKADPTNKKEETKSRDNKKSYCYDCDCKNSIELNTLLLILVALGGFLGNLIHLATSFTTYVGEGKFKRSWILWYSVRPFTAAALAVAFYFVFRGGLLNNGNDSGINIYGVMTFSLLTGLFTDMATLKLKEVFEASFGPKDTRTGSLTGNKISVTEVTPLQLNKTGETIITIKGENLDIPNLSIKVNSEIIPYQLTADKSITLKYTIQPSQAAATSFILEICDSEGKVLYATNLIT
jgi:IPT/TIG domain-containing protein